MENVVSTGPQWTQEEAISYECARECITDLVGIYSGALAEERRMPQPDGEKIASLIAARSALVQERRSLQVADHDHIALIRTKYGAMVRAHRATPQRQAA